MLRIAYRMFVVSIGVILWLSTLGPAVSAATTLQVYAPMGGASRGQAWDEFVVPAFQERFPGVELELILPEGGTEKLRVLIAGGTPPDVAYTPPRDFPVLVNDGVFDPLEPYIRNSSFDPENLPESIFEQFAHEGVLYGLPFDGLAFNVNALYVNLDMFGAAGIAVPEIDYEDPHSGWTYDEFRDITRRLTRDTNGDGSPDQYGFHPTPNTLGSWFRLVWNFGGEIISSEPEWHSAIDSSEAIAGLQYLHDLRFVDEVVGPRPQFVAGSMGVIEAPFAYSANELSDVAFDWTILPQPRGEGGRWGLALNNPMGIVRDSKNKDLAFKFMEFWLSDEVQVYLSDHNVVPPQTYSSARREEFVWTDEPPYDKSALLFGRSRSMPIWTPGWGELLSILRDGMDTIWNDPNTAPGTVAHALDEQIEAIVSRAGSE